MVAMENPKDSTISLEIVEDFMNFDIGINNNTFSISLVGMVLG